jgi:FlaA1/EpsC-like NDP-sugar epimerase
VPSPDTTLVMGQKMPRGISLQAVIYLGLSLVLAVGARAFPRAVRDAMGWGQRLQAAGARRLRNVLVCGAGDRCTLFLREQMMRPPDGRERRVVGLLDDDRNLHGRLVHGYRVMGGIRDIPRLARELGAEEVIVAETWDAETQKRIRAAAAEADVPVFEWRISLDPLAER